MKTMSEEFNLIGEQQLMNQQKTVFFCPFEATAYVFKYIRDWVALLDPMASVIVCGNSTGMERYTLRLLLNKGFAVILPLATTIPENLEELNLGRNLSNEESTKIICRALDEHRLLIVSSKENVSVSVPTRKTLAIRSEWMSQVGDQFIVACHREFDYYDHLLLGKPVYALCNMPQDSFETTASDASASANAEHLAAETAAQRQKALRMGWDIYRLLKKANDMTPEMLNRLTTRYLNLDIEHPSLLHSLILTVVSRNYSEWSAFDYMEFIRNWSLLNLRPEDWKGFRSQSGQLMPSLVDCCLSRMFRQMPSRNLMSLDYGRPFDTQLAHQWIEAALQQSPKNQRHLKKALRLAYYEHDSERIKQYKKLLAV